MNSNYYELDNILVSLFGRSKTFVFYFILIYICAFSHCMITNENVTVRRYNLIQDRVCEDIAVQRARECVFVRALIVSAS